MSFLEKKNYSSLQNSEFLNYLLEVFFVLLKERHGSLIWNIDPNIGCKDARVGDIGVMFQISYSCLSLRVKRVKLFGRGSNYSFRTHF